MTTDKRVDTSVRLPKDTVMKLKHRAIVEDMCMKDLLTQIIEKYLRNGTISFSNKGGVPMK